MPRRAPRQANTREHVIRPRPWAEEKLRFERAYVELLLEVTAGNLAHAAEIARTDRSNFYVRLRRTGVDPDKFRKEE